MPSGYFNCQNGEHRIVWTTDDKNAPPPDGIYNCTACGEEIRWVNDGGESGVELSYQNVLNAESNDCPVCYDLGTPRAAEDCNLGHIRWPQ